MTKVKICGMRTSEDIAHINCAGPDYVGYIFVPGRWRHILPEKAKELSSRLKKNIKEVGVFVNADPAAICRIAAMGFLDAVQLHGQEKEADIRELRCMLDESGLSGIQIWKAFRIENAADLNRAKASSADIILLDCGSGGTGEAFDWSLLDDEGVPSKPWFLAGGLNAATVKDAITRFHPWGVDVSSGVETNRAKDPVKIQTFMEQAKSKNARK